MIFRPWLLWSLLAVLCWGLWGVAGKVIGDSLSASQSQALSTLGILPVMVILLKHARAERPGRAAGFFAGAVVCAGNVPYFYALKIGGTAASVVSVTALYPLVTILLAVVLLKERLNRVQVGGIVLSLMSITVFNIFGIQGFGSAWLLFAMIPVVFWGVGGLLQKISTNTVSGECSTFWFLIAFVPVGAILFLVDPLPSSPPLRIWLWACALGFLFSLGNLAILFAFAREGKASIIAPLAGLYPLVSIPVAIVFLHETVSGREWIGIALALAAVVALAWEGKKTEICSELTN